MKNGYLRVRDKRGEDWQKKFRKKDEKWLPKSWGRRSEEQQRGAQPFLFIFLFFLLIP